MATSRQQYAIDIQNLLDSTRKELEKLRPLSSECCIYRVPDSMRQSRLYKPEIVSIGPIHYGEKELMEMEEHKKRYLQDFLQLCPVTLDECFELVQKNEPRLRNCYADVIKLDSDENFVKIVLVDAVFVLMILFFYAFDFRSLTNSIDRVFQKPKMILKIRNDMVLLGNQLPFFILEDLYKLSKIHNILESKFYPYHNLAKSFDLSDCSFHLHFCEKNAMVILAYHCIVRWNIIKIPKRRPLFGPKDPEHLLALLRSCLKPEDSWNPRRKKLTKIEIPSSKKLYQAGVKFQVGSKENIFDIKFQDGVLDIPPLVVSDDTELVFWNLLAFEASHGLDNLCTDYFIMMHRLTISSEDVEFLVEKEIIENRRSNAQGVSEVFHDLLPGCYFNENRFGYADVVEDLKKHYNIRWNKWKANWVQKYFKAPWAFFSFSAALILLVLTIVQTICSIFQVI